MTKRFALKSSDGKTLQVSGGGIQWQDVDKEAVVEDRVAAVVGA
jgi:hypothetical protein